MSHFEFSTPAGRTPMTVRDWLRARHVLGYSRAFVMTRVLAPSHCECCSASIVGDETYYKWASIDEDHLEYRLCGYCDRQAAILATQFVARLRQVVFGAEQEAFYKWMHDANTDAAGGRDE